LDIDRAASWAGSWMILAGSAQLTVMQLLDDGAAPAVAIAAALMINARFTVYSAGMAEWFPTASRRMRLLLAVPIVDQLYLTATARFARRDLDEADRRRFYVGAAMHLVIAWVVAQTVGVLLGNRLPPWTALQHASLLALVSLLARALSTRRANRAAAGAAVVAFAFGGLPHHSVVLVALLVGMTTGAVGGRS
jgi:predicted branched-subunit amino acid permease